MGWGLGFEGWTHLGWKVAITLIALCHVCNIVGNPQPGLRPTPTPQNPNPKAPTRFPGHVKKGMKLGIGGGGANPGSMLGE